MAASARLLASWWVALPRLALISGAVVVGSCPVVSAETAAPALLKPLELVAYPARTTPPPWSGHTADGRQVSLAVLRGQVVLLNFWASWCVECRPEMPVLERLHRERGRQGLAVVGLPATFLIGRDGRAIGFAIGPRPWGGSAARELFDALLAEPTSLSSKPASPPVRE